MFPDQSSYRVRFEWGRCGLEAVGPGSAAVVVVDVLSFSTCVDVATARGAAVLPYHWQDDSAGRFAAANDAVLASKGRFAPGGYSLSPVSLERIPAGTRLVLPSPNGSALSRRAVAFGATVTACLRNAPAVAAALGGRDGVVSVIACGEQWEDGTLRPAWEDLVGAGAVIAVLSGTRSPEAEAAVTAFRHAERELSRLLRECSSGRELIERGFAADVDLASAFGVSDSVPVLEGVAFVARSDSTGVP